MKPATGSRPSADSNKVSVRIDSGGHSFSVDTLPREVADGECVAEFCVVTCKTVLVPDEVFDETAAANYLAVAGVPCSADETPVTASANGITAVMAVARTFAEAVGRLSGGRARFTTPLLRECTPEGRRLEISTAGDVSCFRICDKGRLRFAEALRTESAEDILYYTSELRSRFGLDEYIIYICGDSAAEKARLLSKYFKGVICE